MLALASPGPASGSVSLSGTLPTPPPKTAAIINIPTSGQHFETSPITISGTCPDATLVVVYKNDIFAGSAPCSAGSFSLKSDLLIGQNTLIARVYDALNQAGPDSNPVTVTYDVLPPQSSAITSLNSSANPLLIYSDAVFRGVFPQQNLNVPITILGGTAPYATDVEWGDVSNNNIPRGDNSTFNASHSYTKPGTYVVSIQATDSEGRIAFLQVVAIVNGTPEVVSDINTAATNTTSSLLVLWPLFAIAATVVASFWLGELREKRLLAATAAKAPPAAAHA